MTDVSVEAGTSPERDFDELSLPYELRIGVTGHRTLDRLAELEGAVDRLLAQIGTILEHQERAPIQWSVISPLAKGADRIVARAALRLPGARLEVVTPFALVEYRKDFVEPEDLQEFEQLLAKAARPAVEFNKDEPPTNAASRNRGYFEVGTAVADSCEILIAIWNGRPAGGAGGTAEIVGHALEHRRTVLWIHTENPAAEPRMLVPAGAHRRATGSVAGVPFRALPLPRRAKQLSIGYHRLAAFLRDSAIDKSTFAGSVKREAAMLLDQAREAGLDESRLQPSLSRLLPYYVRADKLAMHYQKRHVLGSKALFYLSAAAVSVVVFQVIFLPRQTWIILFEIAAMVGVVAWLWTSRRQAWHDKWIHDRFLAEQLRISIFTLLFEEDPTGRLAHAPRTLPFYVGPQNWLPGAVRQILAQTSIPQLGPRELDAVRRFIVQAWLGGQRKFHERAAQRKERLYRRARRLVLSLFCITLTMAVLHLLGLGEAHDRPPLLAAGPWFTFLAIVLPAWGAAVHGISKQFEYERIAARSEQMTRLLNHFVERAEQASSWEQLRKIVQEAAHVMCLENYEWWVLLSFEPPELAP
jgi:hypothetical protein